MKITRPFTLGAVAYDPKVVTIWEGFKDWFASQGFAFDYVLYSSYETQAEAHLAGHVDVTWDSRCAESGPAASQLRQAGKRLPSRCETPTRT